MMSAPGYIYIAYMLEMPNCVKVGLTTREPRVRLSELSGTSSPLPFRLLMQWEVTNTVKAEKAAHDALSDVRVSSNREFFRVDGPEAISLVGQAVKPYLEPMDELSAVEGLCAKIAEDLFRWDYSTNPASLLSSEKAKKLEEEIRNFVSWHAQFRIAKGRTIDAVVCAADIAWWTVAVGLRPDHLPRQIAEQFIDRFSAFMNLVSIDFYLQDGVQDSANVTLQFSAEVTKAIAEAMRRSSNS